MKLVEVRPDGTGTADLDGARTEVNLSLLEAAAVGDFVIIHAGFAIEKLDANEADERIRLFEEIGRLGAEEQGSQGKQ
jgi:hydrogenase expression/formation protein HypC